MITVNEKTTAYVDVQFFDADSAAAQPTTATWQLDCVTTGERLVEPTAFTPTAGAARITVPATYTGNRSGKPREVKRVTVIAQYGSAADQVTGMTDFAVVNLSGVT